MSKYRDRGIIKWAPFDGLASFHEMFASLKYRLGQGQMKDLHEDKLAELNLKLTTCLQSSQKVSIIYFFDGYTYSVYAPIEHFDPLKRRIKISNYYLNLSQIIDITLDNED